MMTNKSHKINRKLAGAAPKAFGVACSDLLGSKIVITQCAPKNENITVPATQSHTNAVKQNAGVNEWPRLRKLSG